MGRATNGEAKGISHPVQKHIQEVSEKKREFRLPKFSGKPEASHSASKRNDGKDKTCEETHSVKENERNILTKKESLKESDRTSEDHSKGDNDVSISEEIKSNEDSKVQQTSKDFDANNNFLDNKDVTSDNRNPMTVLEESHSQNEAKNVSKSNNADLLDKGSNNSKSKNKNSNINLNNSAKQKISSNPSIINTDNKTSTFNNTKKKNNAYDSKNIKNSSKDKPNVANNSASTNNKTHSHSEIPGTKENGAGLRTSPGMSSPETLSAQTNDKAVFSNNDALNKSLLLASDLTCNDNIFMYAAGGKNDIDRFGNWLPPTSRFSGNSESSTTSFEKYTNPKRPLSPTSALYERLQRLDKTRMYEFRHYPDEPARYIKDYRRVHTVGRVGRADRRPPVLGRDIADPYAFLPTKKSLQGKAKDVKSWQQKHEDIQPPLPPYGDDEQLYHQQQQQQQQQQELQNRCCQKVNSSPQPMVMGHCRGFPSLAPTREATGFITAAGLLNGRVQKSQLARSSTMHAIQPNMDDAKFLPVIPSPDTRLSLVSLSSDDVDQSRSVGHVRKFYENQQVQCRSDSSAVSNSTLTPTPTGQTASSQDPETRLDQTYDREITLTPAEECEKKEKFWRNPPEFEKRYSPQRDKTKRKKYSKDDRDSPEDGCAYDEKSLGSSGVTDTAEGNPNTKAERKRLLKRDNDYSRLIIEVTNLKITSPVPHTSRDRFDSVSNTDGNATPSDKAPRSSPCTEPTIKSSNRQTDKKLVEAEATNQNKEHKIHACERCKHSVSEPRRTKKNVHIHNTLGQNRPPESWSNELELKGKEYRKNFQTAKYETFPNPNAGISPATSKASLSVGSSIDLVSRYNEAFANGSTDEMKGRYFKGKSLRIVVPHSELAVYSEGKRVSSRPQFTRHSSEGQSDVEDSSKETMDTARSLQHTYPLEDLRRFMDSGECGLIVRSITVDRDTEQKPEKTPRNESVDTNTGIATKESTADNSVESLHAKNVDLQVVGVIAKSVGSFPKKSFVKRNRRSNKKSQRSTASLVGDGISQQKEEIADNAGSSIFAKEDNPDDTAQTKPASTTEEMDPPAERVSKDTEISDINKPNLGHPEKTLVPQVTLDIGDVSIKDEKQQRRQGDGFVSTIVNQSPFRSHPKRKVEPNLLQVRRPPTFDPNNSLAELIKATARRTNTVTSIMQEKGNNS